MNPTKELQETLSLILHHSNKECTKNRLNFNQSSLHSIKCVVIPVPPRNPHNTMWNHKPQGIIALPTIHPFPIRKEIYHLEWHYPLHPQTKSDNSASKKLIK